MSLGNMITVDELEWVHQPSCVFHFDLVPVPHVTDPLLLFLTAAISLDFQGRAGMGTTGLESLTPSSALTKDDSRGFSELHTTCIHAGGVCHISTIKLLPDDNSSPHRDTRAILEQQGTLENR